MIMSRQFEQRYRLSAIAAAALVATAGVAGGTTYAQPATEYQKTRPAAAAAHGADDREVFIGTVHLDGNGNVKGDAKHPAEPFPVNPLPPGGGLSLTPPAEDGAWRVRAFVFEPRQVVVFKGGPVKLNFVGVQGPSHRIQIDGQSEIVELKRGEVKTVTIPTDVPGAIGFRSLDRLPSMQGSVIVLPRP